MKHINLAIICLLSFYIGSAKEKNKKIILSPQVDLVKVFAATDNSACTQYDLPAEVFSWKYDAGRQEIIVLLKDKGMNMSRGYLAIYDIPSASFRWEMPVNLFDVFASGDRILLTSSATTICYDRANGSLLWRADDIRIRHVDTLNQVGISSLGKGLDLVTGKVIWTRKLKGSDYWSDFKVLNDTMLACVSNGLHIFNTRTGIGVDIEGKTEKNDHNALVLGVVGGVFSGVVGALVLSSLSGDGQMAGLSSQMVIDNNELYFAMMDKICCVDLVSYQVKWSRSLVSRSGSRSCLYLLDGNIALVNDGLSGVADKAILTGTPFIGVYNKANGGLVHEQYLDLKYGALHDRKMQGDTLTFIYSRSICKLNVTNGREYINVRNVAATTWYESFADPGTVYIGQPDVRLVRIDSAYPDLSELIVDHMHAFVALNSSCTQFAKFEKPELGFKIAEKGQYAVIIKDKASYILNDGVPVIRIDSKDKGQVIGERYYQFAGDKMTIVDLKP